MCSAWVKDSAKVWVTWDDRSPYVFDLLPFAYTHVSISEIFPITSVDIISGQYPFSPMIDNIVSIVPEPNVGSILLIGIAIGGLRRYRLAHKGHSFPTKST